MANNFLRNPKVWYVWYKFQATMQCRWANMEKQTVKATLYVMPSLQSGEENNRKMVRVWINKKETRNLFCLTLENSCMWKVFATFQFSFLRPRGLSYIVLTFGIVSPWKLLRSLAVFPFRKKESWTVQSSTLIGSSRGWNLIWRGRWCRSDVRIF